MSLSRGENHSYVNSVSSYESNNDKNYVYDKNSITNNNNNSGINARNVGVLRYSASIVDWTMKKQVSTNRRTRNILTINGWMFAHKK